MLLVALTTGFAVVVVATTIAVAEFLKMRPTALSTLSTYSEVLAIHSTAALSFDDRAAGAETLSALRAVPEIAAAGLYNSEGQLFAAYQSPGTEVEAPAMPDADGHRFEDRRIHLTVPVRHEGRTLGTLQLSYELDGLYKDVNSTILMGAIIGVVAMGLALLLALRLRRGLAQPVEELTAAAQRVSRTKDYSTRARKINDDELGELTDTFNLMISRIEKFQKVQQQSEEHRRRYTADLERSNRELDEFAYVASHDLRSPLQGIKNLAHWIAEDNADKLPEKSRRHLEQMEQRVERLETLLDDLLQYSRAGRVHGAIVEVDTGQLCKDTVGLLSPPDGFEVKIASDMPRFETASVPLEQVFRNLINNAIKHHDRDDGKISIFCKPNGQTYGFSVTDDGPGIERKYHQQIFKMFETLSPRDTVEGSGMGLAVIKKIVESCGGSIGVESAGRGTTFSFTWPREFPGGEQQHGR